jgi:predicted outer membrane repeat protein
MRAKLWALAGGTAIGALLATSASAETLHPTRFDDPTPGRCKERDCSLREAVLKANKKPGSTTIKLEKGRYKLERAALGNEFQFTTGDLDVLAPLKVIGKGAGRTRINARGVDRLFDLRLAESTRFVFKRLTLMGGNAEENADQPPNPWGGAIQTINGDITLAKAAIRDNHDNEFGGAIFAYRASIELRRSTMDGNTSDGRGGGIYAEQSSVTIDGSTVSNNEADVYGGGLFMPHADNPPNEAVIRDSTFLANRAAVGAGIGLDLIGIFTPGPPPDAVPDVDIINSTFANNEASLSGGGISAVAGANLLVDNSTIAYNVADSDNQGGGSGGGIHEASATVSVGDSILAQNTLGSTALGGRACNGNYTNLGGNVISQWTAPCSMPETHSDAGIEPPAENGGPTQTIALTASSPALGAAQSCPPRDQRGVARPATGCDSGSFESPLVP